MRTFSVSPMYIYISKIYPFIIRKHFIIKNNYSEMINKCSNLHC